jgi:hypothetical protein
MNSRQKGAVAEREVAALVQAWWRQLEPECLFVRTPSSGGWSGPQVREAFEASGDLMTTAKHFPFAVEVKRRENWCLDRVLAAMPSPVWGWWRQAVRAAREVHRHPLLVFRKSREPWCVLLPTEMLVRLRVGLPLLRGQEHDRFWLPVDFVRYRVDVDGVHPAFTSLDRLLLVPPTELSVLAAPRTGSR